VAELDLEFVRAQFPAFGDARTAGWAHLENAGGSYVPRQVIDLLTEFFVTSKVQPYYAGEPSRRAGEAMDRAIEAIPATLGAARDEVMLGPSTSANTYVVAHALREQLREGDEVVVTNQDHEANIGSWRRLARTGITVKEWSVDPVTGLLDLADLSELLTERTRLVAVTHASNIAATVNPVRAVADLVHAVGGLVAVDGVSYAPHAAVDVRALDCDFYFYSAYKTFGPHQGVMFVRAEVLDGIANQGHFFNADHPTYRLTPAGPDHAEVAATAGIIDYCTAVYEHHFGSAQAVAPTQVVRGAYDLFAAQEQELMEPVAALLTARDGVRLVGTPSWDHRHRAPTFAFTSARRSSRQVVADLAAAQVSSGSGHFYAYRLLDALGIDLEDGVVRLSMVHYNTRAEVDRALEVLDRVI
jgi:cysteine desulfurase family protein (TIGR01976 family)